jgi:hypothetical protein
MTISKKEFEKIQLLGFYGNEINRTITKIKKTKVEKDITIVLNYLSLHRKLNDLADYQLKLLSELTIQVEGDLKYSIWVEKANKIKVECEKTIKSALEYIFADDEPDTHD